MYQGVKLDNGTVFQWSIRGTTESNRDPKKSTKVGSATDGKSKWLVFENDGGLLFTDPAPFGHEWHKMYFAMFFEPVEDTSS